MRNISISQIFVVVIIGVLMFSDFSKGLKSIRNLIKVNKIHKDSKKK